MPTETFDRFKYAEEAAHRLHNKGHLFRLTNAHAVPNEDDCLSDEFTVEDLGPVHPSLVNKTGYFLPDLCEICDGDEIEGVKHEYVEGDVRHVDGKR